MSGRNTGVGEELIWLAVILVIFLMLAMIVTPIVLVGMMGSGKSAVGKVKRPLQSCS
jgi:hypothetical protein